MKELSIEEKARRYDEAIGRAKNYYSTTDSSSDIKLIGLMFPELIESEDEKIRKVFIDCTESYLFWNKIGVTKEKALAWLEKQGEHANFRNKIQIGDKVTRNEDGVLINLSQLKRVAKKDEKQGENNMGISEATKKKLEDNLNKALEKETPESCNEFLEKQGEKKSYAFEAMNEKEDFDSGFTIMMEKEQKPWSEKEIEL